MIEIEYKSSRKKNLETPKVLLKKVKLALEKDQEEYVEISEKLNSLDSEIEIQVNKELLEHTNKIDEISLQIKKLANARRIITSSMKKERRKRTSELGKQKNITSFRRKRKKLIHSLSEKGRDVDILIRFIDTESIKCRPINYKV